MPQKGTRGCLGRRASTDGMKRKCEHDELTQGEPEEAAGPAPDATTLVPESGRNEQAAPRLGAMAPPFRENSGRSALEKGCSLRDPGPKATARLVRRPPSALRASRTGADRRPPAPKMHCREGGRKEKGATERPPERVESSRPGVWGEKELEPKGGVRGLDRKVQRSVRPHRSPPCHLGQVVTSPSSACNTRPVISTPARYREDKHETAQPDPRRPSENKPDDGDL